MLGGIRTKPVSIVCLNNFFLEYANATLLRKYALKSLYCTRNAVFLNILCNLFGYLKNMNFIHTEK